VGDANEDRAKVIRFWRAVELFSPRGIPKVNPPKHVCQIAEGGLLPWEPGHPRCAGSPLPQSRTWLHRLYGGIFSLQRVRILLEDASGSESFDARPLAAATAPP